MKYRFGGFEVDDLTRELSFAGKNVSAEPKVLEFLLLLVRNESRVVPKQTILTEIWPGVCVGESSIYRLVNEARRVLAQDPSLDSAIRTVRGSGYRFASTIERVGNPELNEAECLIQSARDALESAVERGTSDLRFRMDEFVSVCRLALERARVDLELGDGV